VKRTWPLIAVFVAYIAATLIWIGNDRRIARNTFDIFSAANTSDQGFSLAMKYLARSGQRKVNLLTTPPDGTLPANAVVFRAIKGQSFSLKDLFGDEDDDKDKEKENAAKRQPAPKKKKKPRTKHVEPLLSDDEEAFVRNGGRFVIATAGHYDVNLATRNVVPAKKAVKVFPIWPGIDQILLPKCRTLLASEVMRRAHVLYAIDDDAAIARIFIGRGELILIAVPELFDNEHIAQHLDLLTALAGDRRIVYFDETVHGLLNDTGTLDLLRRWRLGPALVLLLLIAFVTIWRGARRVGAPEDDYRDTRSDAVDLVSSLGALYDESTSYAEGIALYHQALTQTVAAQTGLRGEPLHKRVSTLTHDLRPPNKSDRIEIEEFKGMLSTLNEAFRKTDPHADHH
jgi:hypothetical protein